MRGWFWWMRPLKNYSQHLLQQTSLFLDVSWKVSSVGDSAAVIHRLFSLFTFINKFAAVWMSNFRNSVNLLITCIWNLLPSWVQSIFSNTGTDSFPGGSVAGLLTGATANSLELHINSLKAWNLWDTELQVLSHLLNHMDWFSYPETPGGSAAATGNWNRSPIPIWIE